MRDAARDVGPGGAALRRHQVGDVVERDDEALDLAARALLRDLDVEGALLAVARELDLAVRRPAASLPRLLENRPQLREQPRPAGGRCRSLSSSPSAASAERLTSVTRPGRVEADDAGGDAGQHRLGEAPPLVDLLVRVEQFVALRSSAGRSWC